ncbi:AraC family transcriptional regulator [Aliagarivorans taiwanensis]|uniref:AraC family transcriptional regulator n=1 Tax=Aliagarivorans taiwanensis TaxID=561966 RepID=UPI00041E67CE|nr:helix-turn-helix domain-containing protein [Aliagarivorans taiwanensis]
MTLDTEISRERRINDVLYHIHRNLDGDLRVSGLAKVAAYSDFHFQRCFKVVTGESVNDYVRRTRLERCANLLVFNPTLSIQRAAAQCGLSSPASFSRSFKEYFGVSPKQWRNGGHRRYSAENLQQNWGDELRRQLTEPCHLAFPEVRIDVLQAQAVAYVRHRGYDRSINRAYDKLRVWAAMHGVPWQQDKLLGLLHSNPDIVPADACHYVACLQIEQENIRRGPVCFMTIPGGPHARLSVKGKFGDLLPVLHHFYHHWLPESGYILGNTPAFVGYRQCHFVDPDESFDLDLFVPISL